MLVTQPRARSREEPAWLLWFGVALVTLLLLGKVYLTRGLVLSDWRILPAVILEAPLVIALVALVTVVAGARHRAALLVVAVAASYVLFATAVYAEYFSQVLTPALIVLAGQTDEVAASVLDLLRPVHALYGADLVLLASAVFVLARRYPRDGAHPASAPSRRPLLAVAVLALAMGALVISGAWRLPGDANGVAAARAKGLIGYQIASLRGQESDAIAGASPGRDLASVVSSRSAELRGDTDTERIADFPPGAFAGKNLIVIQVEALQSGLIGATIDGVAPMPRLTEIAKESWYFPRTYSQISRGNTADVEWVVNTSLYPPPGQAASVRWGDREVPSLPRLLGRQGYATLTFHANTARFWNRENLYAALGFDRFYDRDDFPSEPYWKWGTSDEEVFDTGLDRLLELRAQERLFYAQFVTMSTHHPFEYPPDELRPYRPPARLQGTAVGEYLSSESYVDKAVGEFVDELKRTGLWDESVVVIYGDHFGLRRPENARDRAAATEVFPDGYDDTDYLAVPLIVHLPSQQRGRVVDATVGQVDVMPTLADVFGLDLGATPYFGRNAFVQGRELIGQRGMVAEGSMLNDRILFQPGIGFEDGSALDLRTGRPVPTNASDRADFAAMREAMRLSLAYTDRLPRRTDAGSGSDAIIPNRDRLAPGAAEPASPTAP